MNADIVNDLDNLRHMLGISSHRARKHWCYRNYFNAGDCDKPSMERLVVLGLAEQFRPDYWRATEAGCKAVGLTEKETKRALHGD